MENQIQITEVESNIYLFGKILSQIGLMTAILFMFVAAIGTPNMTLLIVSMGIFVTGLAIRFIAKRYTLKTMLRTEV